MMFYDVLKIIEMKCQTFWWHSEPDPFQSARPLSPVPLPPQTLGEGKVTMAMQVDTISLKIPKTQNLFELEKKKIYWTVFKTRGHGSAGLETSPKNQSISAILHCIGNTKQQCCSLTLSMARSIHLLLLHCICYWTLIGNICIQQMLSSQSF